MSELERTPLVTSGRPAWSEQRLVRLLVLGQSRPLAVTVLVGLLLAAALIPDWRPLEGLRLALFDSYQRSFPRKRESAPAVIVAIDEASLTAHGQWPWPRSVLARLLALIGRAGPAAIGLDLLLPEPDRLSAAQLASSLPGVGPRLRSELAKLPDGDALLAGTLRRLPVTLGIAGLETGQAPAVPPRSVPFLVRGGDPSRFLRQFPGVLRSVEAIDAAAAGHGLLSADATDGVVRRVPMVARVAGVMVPSLSLDMLRLAAGETALALRVDASGVREAAVGDLTVPTAPDGSLWVRFGPPDSTRFISATDVLAGNFERERFEHKLVLIGFTGLGLLDYQAIPLGSRMPGVEVHAQILENMFDRQFLQRPAWAGQVERVVLVVCGALLIVLVPLLRPRLSTVIYIIMMSGLLFAGFASYRTQGLLLDMALPVAGASLVFGALLAGTLADADMQRRQLGRALDEQRETAARLLGELEAARRIQLGMLPPASGELHQDPRFTLHAIMEPAHEVGGDLYDFFKVGEGHLLFLVGDVSGKGVPASIFMAVSKALYKSIALRRSTRDRLPDLGGVMTAANVEISRDNPGMLFVTLFAGLLDLESGRLEYCNAGHDAPHALPYGQEPVRLDGGWGPPLCAVEEFQYAAAMRDLQPGETLVLVSDGVPEAMDRGGRLYGRQRLVHLLADLARAEPEIIAAAIREHVRSFVGDAEPSDDLTVLVVRWNGPAGKDTVRDDVAASESTNQRAEGRVARAE